MGVDTVIADNPYLTVRLVEGESPLPIVLDSRLRLPLNSNLLRNKVPPLIATTTLASREKQEKIEEFGAKIIRTTPDEKGWVDLHLLLGALANLGISNVMVEGGARVITSFLSQHLVDWVVITIAPTFLGGLHALENPLVPYNRECPDSSLPEFNNFGYEQVGKDIVFWSALSWASPVNRSALYFTAPGSVEVREEPVPPLKPDQVLVRTLFSAISPGTELLIYRQQISTEQPLDMNIRSLSGNFQFPLKYGYSTVGKVVATGSEIDSSWMGKKVFVFHPHESLFAAYPDELIEIPGKYTLIRCGLFARHGDCREFCYGRTAGFRGEGSSFRTGDSRTAHHLNIISISAEKSGYSGSLPVTPSNFPGIRSQNQPGPSRQRVSISNKVSFQ